jgi:hypothetical protein
MAMFFPPACWANADIQLPSDVNDKLIAIPSFKRSPSVPAFETLSLENHLKIYIIYPFLSVRFFPKSKFRL